MIILGIDPGTRVTGYALLKNEGGRVTLLEHGLIKLPAKKHLTERVARFHDQVEDKIKTWNVTHLALETPFLGKNAQNFIKLGYLRGILYLFAHKYSLVLCEFSPRSVKQVVTGYGGASKEQVARVLTRLFPGILFSKEADDSDALAVTVCGLWQENNIISPR